MSTVTPTAESQATPPPAPLHPVVSHSPLTFRAIVLGFFLVLFLSILTPYSDYARHNTFLIGNHLPLVVIVVITVLSLVINPLLGRRRFSTGEMTVAISMMLIACAFPACGLFRYFHVVLANTVYFASGHEWYHKYINTLPDWLFPAKDPGNSIIDDFYNGINPRSGHTLWGSWGPWIKPYLAWSCFLLPLYGAIMFVCALMRKQWVVNERLAFPLAAIPAELMAAPHLGERFSPLWKNRLLWIGAAIPFVIHLNNGLHSFYNTIPNIDLYFNLNGKLTEYPWNELHWSIKFNQIYFSVVGVTFFVPLEIAFSIWFFFLAYQIGTIFFRRAGIDINDQHWTYQGLGIYLAYGVSIFWIARHHMVHIARNLFKPREPEEFLPYGVAVGGLLACLLVACSFLWFVGVTWWFAPLIPLILIFWMIILSRIVMEAGVLFIQVPHGADPIRMLGIVFEHTTDKFTWLRNFMTSSLTLRFGLTDQREGLMPFAANTMALGSKLKASSRPRFFLLLILAIVLALVAAGVTHHLISYHFGRSHFDNYANNDFPRDTMDQARAYAEPGTNPVKLNRGYNIAYGAGALVLVSASRFLLTASPFHPIGLVMLNSYAEQRIWFSVMVAWALKLVILRWGGAKVYTKARPFFIGLLVGESLAGVLWIIVGLFVNWPSTPYQILPG